MGGVCPPNPPLGDEAPPPGPLRKGAGMLRLVSFDSELGQKARNAKFQAWKIEQGAWSLWQKPRSPKLKAEVAKFWAWHLEQMARRFEL